MHLCDSDSARKMYYLRLYTALVTFCCFLRFAQAGKSAEIVESFKTKGETGEFLDPELLRPKRIQFVWEAGSTTEPLPIQRSKGDEERLDPRGPRVRYEFNENGQIKPGIVYPIKPAYYNVELQRGGDIKQAKGE